MRGIWYGSELPRKPLGAYWQQQRCAGMCPWRLRGLPRGVLKWQEPILRLSGVSHGGRDDVNFTMVDFASAVPLLENQLGWVCTDVCIRHLFFRIFLMPGLLTGTINVLLYLETVFICQRIVIHFDAFNLTSRHANQPNQKPYGARYAVPQWPWGQHHAEARHCADPGLHLLGQAYWPAQSDFGWVLYV
jgi:hypothetical protein